MRLEPYQDDLHRDAWEEFVSSRARNAHFMHRRRYIDHHGERFDDGSLLFFGDKATPLAILPANCSGPTCVSHAGLSFAGLLVSGSFRMSHWQEAFALLGEHLRSEGIATLDYRPTPPWYHTLPGEEDVYLIEAAGHQPTVLASALCRIRGADPSNTNRRREARSTLRSGVEVEREDSALGEVMTLVAETLRRRHATEPVHGTAEIAELSRRFPDEIRCYTARDRSGALLAGKVLFCSPTVVKLQYVGYQEGSAASSAIYAHVFGLDELRERWFDFGTSMSGGELDKGLFAYKESLGGRLAPVRRYLLPTDVAPLK